jgi:hypothetical protein
VYSCVCSDFLDGGWEERYGDWREGACGARDDEARDQRGQRHSTMELGVEGAVIRVWGFAREVHFGSEGAAVQCDGHAVAGE